MTAGRLANSRNTRARLIVYLALLLATPALAATPNFPALTGRVVDDAGVLSSSTQSDLSETLARHAQATGEQVVVVTLRSLQGFAIEDFGYQLGRAWGIGQKGKNTGAILIIAPNDHKVRIEVGYGLEGKLTDAQSRVIIERDILPAFRRGDFDAGVTAGTASILTVLGGDVASPATTRHDAAWSPPGSSRLVSPLLIFGIYGLFYLFWMRRARHYRAGRYGGVWRSSAADPLGIGMIGNRYPRGPFYGGGFGGGGFGGGGGGFSGGGGSFGGGGASGGW
jgi:uncharacterized protein